MLRVSRDTARIANVATNPSQSSNIIDVTVSYVWTWHKRGHTSVYRIGVLIDVVTYLVMFFEILSKCCPECTMTMKDFGKNSLELDISKSDHAEKCQKIFDASSASRKQENQHSCYMTWKCWFLGQKIKDNEILSLIHFLRGRNLAVKCS